MVHDPAHSSPVPPTQDVDRSRKAKLRIGRSLFLLSSAAVVLCAIVVWHRDATHITKACDRIEPAVAAINRYLMENDTLPILYPVRAGLDAPPGDDGFKYVDPSIIRWARTVDRPVVIGYGASEGLIVKPNGRPVAIHQDHHVRVEWMSGRDLGALLTEQQRLAGGAAGNRSDETPPTPSGG